MNKIFQLSLFLSLSLSSFQVSAQSSTIFNQYMRCTQVSKQYKKFSLDWLYQHSLVSKSQKYRFRKLLNLEHRYWSSPIHEYQHCLEKQKKGIVVICWKIKRGRYDRPSKYLSEWTSLLESIQESSSGGKKKGFVMLLLAKLLSSNLPYTVRWAALLQFKKANWDFHPVLNYLLFGTQSYQYRGCGRSPRDVGMLSAIQRYLIKEYKFVKPLLLCNLLKVNNKVKPHFIHFLRLLYNRHWGSFSFREEEFLLFSFQRILSPTRFDSEHYDAVRIFRHISVDRIQNRKYLIFMKKHILRYLKLNPEQRKDYNFLLKTIGKRLE